MLSLSQHFIVMIAASAREVAGLENNLTLGSLIRVRLVTSFVVYFFISVCTVPLY